MECSHPAGTAEVGVCAALQVVHREIGVVDAAILFVGIGGNGEAAASGGMDANIHTGEMVSAPRAMRSVSP